MSALHDALSQHNMDEVKRILQSKDSNVTLSQIELDSALVAAISGDGTDDCIAELLSRGAKITDGSIRAAAARGDVVAFDAFLEHGWDINSLEFGHPALRRVLAHESVVQWFFGHGADPNLRGSKNFSIFATAIHESSDTSLLELLISHGAELDPQALYNAMSPRSRGGGISVMKFLIDQGIELNAPGVLSRYHFATPLYYAASLRNTEMVKLLLDAGADPTITTYGKTPLDLAKEKGSMEMVNILSS